MRVIILSGGMDSTVALYQAVEKYGAKNVKAINFNYQSKHNDQEYLRAKRSCYKLKVWFKRIDLSTVSKHLKSDLLKTGGKIPDGHYAAKIMKKTVVPFRNGIMLAIACGIAESFGGGKVIIGNHAGDHAIYPDCRTEFINAMDHAMTLGTYLKVKIVSPFGKKTKADIAKIGDKLGVDWRQTYSCYKGGPVHCGVCSTCYERREAFILAGVEDPTRYLDRTTFSALRKKYSK